MTDIKKQARKFLAWRAKQAKDVYDEMTAEPKTDDLVRRYDCGKSYVSRSLAPNSEWARREANSALAKSTRSVRRSSHNPVARGGW